MLRKILKFGLPLIIIGIAISIAGYLKATKPVVEPKTLTERVWTVAVIPAKTENVRPRIKLFGEIVSGRTVDLRPQVAGKILRASPNLVEGGVVRAGEVIVDIDPFDYQAALRQRKAELLEAQGRLKELKAELSGAVTLWIRTNLRLRSGGRMRNDVQSCADPAPVRPRHQMMRGLR